MLSGVLIAKSASPEIMAAAVAGPEPQATFSTFVKPNDSNTPISMATKFGRAVYAGAVQTLISVTSGGARGAASSTGAAPGHDASISAVASATVLSPLTTAVPSVQKVPAPTAAGIKSEASKRTTSALTKIFKNDCSRG